MPFVVVSFMNIRTEQTRAPAAFRHWTRVQLRGTIPFRLRGDLRQNPMWYSPNTPRGPENETRKRDITDFGKLDKDNQIFPVFSLFSGTVPRGCQAVWPPVLSGWQTVVAKCPSFPRDGTLVGSRAPWPRVRANWDWKVCDSRPPPRIFSQRLLTGDREHVYTIGRRGKNQRHTIKIALLPNPSGIKEKTLMSS